MHRLYNIQLGHASNRTDSLTQSIRLLNALAIKLKAQRMAAGALNLASPEVKINLGSAESSDPIDVEQKELRETNSLVEEFMLLANVSVAKKIDEVFPQTAVLRYVVSLDFLVMRYRRLFRQDATYLRQGQISTSFRTCF